MASPGGPFTPPEGIPDGGHVRAQAADDLLGVLVLEAALLVGRRRPSLAGSRRARLGGLVAGLHQSLAAEALEDLLQGAKAMGKRGVARLVCCMLLKNLNSYEAYYICPYGGDLRLGVTAETGYNGNESQQI